jgi:CubicO group peptidase (beta-lactamase class C family)
MSHDTPRPDALGQIPWAHAVALRLRDAGASHALIAHALGLAPESVPALLAVAEAKLRRAQANTSSPLLRTSAGQPPTLDYVNDTSLDNTGAAGLNLHPPAVDPTTQSLVPIPAGRVAGAVAALDEIIHQLLGATGVPGLAASVVHRGELLYAKGFGVCDINTGVPVNAKTVFHLASVSKSLSSTVAAGLVGRKLVQWTDPVAAHLPGFALADPYVAANVSYGDMFSHSSGLPDHAGDLLEDLGYGQSYILHALRLEKLSPFRSTYAYTNFGFTAAAVSAAAAAGKDWATVADMVLFGPLGMSATSYRHADFIAQADRASMHVRIEGKWYQKYSRDADPEAPAGGASSNVIDLAEWMALKLASGTWHGTPVIDPAALLEADTPRSVPGPPQTPSSRTGFYGFGTNVGPDYSGRVHLSHSGAFAQGAATNYILLPDQQLGIMVLTNGMPIGLPEAATAYFMDLVIGGTIENDWFGLYTQLFSQLYINPSELAGKTPPAHPKPAQPGSFYTGTYHNGYYGDIEVIARGSGLHVIMQPKPTDYPLEHWDGNLFAFFPVGENALGISAATFVPGPGSHRATSLTLEYYNATGLGVFTRH